MSKIMEKRQKQLKIYSHRFLGSGPDRGQSWAGMRPELDHQLGQITPMLDQIEPRVTVDYLCNGTMTITGNPEDPLDQSLKIIMAPNVTIEGTSPTVALLN